MKKIILCFILILTVGLIFAQETNSSNFRINTIKLSNISFKSPNGIDWDAFSNPDVFMEIYDYLGNLILSTDVFEDVNGESFPLEWFVPNGTFSFTNDTNNSYQFRVYDSDLTKNELIDETEFCSLSCSTDMENVIINTKKYSSIELELYIEHLFE